MTEQTPDKEGDDVSTTLTVQTTESTQIRLHEAQSSNQQLVELNSKLLEDKQRMLEEQEKTRKEMEDLRKMMENLKQAQETKTSNVISPQKRSSEETKSDNTHDDFEQQPPANEEEPSVEADNAGVEI